MSNRLKGVLIDYVDKDSLSFVLGYLQPNAKKELLKQMELKEEMNKTFPRLGIGSTIEAGNIVDCLTSMIK